MINKDNENMGVYVHINVYIIKYANMSECTLKAVQLQYNVPVKYKMLKYFTDFYTYVQQVH